MKEPEHSKEDDNNGSEAGEESGQFRYHFLKHDKDILELARSPEQDN